MTMAGPEPEWLVKGDNAWQMLAGTLVGLQSVPGLVILYGSIVKKKWAVNSAFMALYAFAAVLVCWALVGFRMSFGDQMLPMWGWPNTILGPKYLTQQAKYHNQPQDLFFPMSTLIYYQFAFAALTVILIAGSILGRMNFWAWMMFVPLWLLFSYTVGAFSLWGGGFLFQLGVIDFSGGYVIHVSSGVAGLVAAYWVGPRLPQDRERFPPNNVLLMLCGAGILWLGWNGFNGGAPYAAGQDASLAILNTNLSAATALLTWTALDIFYFRKPSVIGAVQGMFAGLVCITPGAGLVHGWVAMVYGIAAGTVPWFTMMKLHRQIRFLAQIDDTLGVFHTHAVAGVIGGLLTGLFATQDMCSIFGCKKEVHQNRGPQVLKQLAGALFVAGWNVVITSIILLVIRLVVPLRMSDEQLAVGDDAAHGEEAYALWEDGDRYDDSVRSKYDESVRSKFDDPSVRGPWNADPRDVEMQRQIAEHQHQHQHHLPNNHAMAVFAMSTKSPPVLMATSSPGMAIRAPDHRSPTKIG